MKTTNRKNGSVWFPYLLMMQFALIVTESGYLLNNNMHYFLATVVASYHIAAPTGLWIAVAQFWLWQIALNLLLVIAIWTVARGVNKFFAWDGINYRRLILSLWVLATLATLTANQWLYPGSRFGYLTALFFPGRVAVVILTVSSLLLALAILLALIQLLRSIWRHSYYGRALLALVVIFSVGGTIGTRAAIAGHHATPALDGSSDRPNIFIIGIDALRPDHIGFYGDQQNDTPELDRFLSHATNFMNSITPLARTYPAWVSILSGDYPVESGVRYNLMAVKGNWLNHTLAATLRHHGYATFFAMDDRDFAHIDYQFGFDHTWGPPLDAATFIIAPMSVYPLSNLLANTRLGAWFFPYSYDNRNASETYDPDRFLKQIERNLLKVKKRPLFLAIHFCLPHWPYTWGKVASQSDMTIDQFYRQAVLRAQRQVMDLIGFLQTQGLLQHAVVILISDHGEGLGLRGDRPLTADKFIADHQRQKRLHDIKQQLDGDNGELNTSYGHGTDVLSFSQYHNLLAIRTYGLATKNVAQRVDRMVSLVDIKPTLLQLLTIKDSFSSANAQSLLPWIEGKPIVNNQPVWTFVEGGFNPKAVMASKVIVSDVAREGAEFYYVDHQSGQLTLQQKVVPQLLAHNKQRAIYYQHWLLAFYPRADGSWQPIIVNRQTGEWSDSLYSSLARKAPLQTMLRQFCRAYTREIAAFCIKK
ncbi:MAG: sulfatase-like hydrolase/transferase [Gammaproteobacteria bacterium]|nr:sulfatase-like hydrolase/transferase [Gammaproteobacteria bacterium]